MFEYNLMSIKAIVVARVNDYKEERVQLTSLSAVHNLYAYFLDTVNADIIFSDTDTLLDGNVALQTKEYLLSHLKKAVEHMPVYAVTGSSQYIAEQISKL
jgi:hypothetical protein